MDNYDNDDVYHGGFVDHQPHHDPGKHINFDELIYTDDDGNTHHGAPLNHGLNVIDYDGDTIIINGRHYHLAAGNRPTVVVYRDDYDDLVAALALDDDANRYLHLYAAATNLTTHAPTPPGDGITR